MVQIAQHFPPPDSSPSPSSGRSSNVTLAIFPRFGIMMKLVTPDDVNDSDSGSYDQLGFQTLTFTRDPISQEAAPSGLSGHLINDSVVLSWWGSAYATNYSLHKTGSAVRNTRIPLVRIHIYMVLSTTLGSIMERLPLLRFPR